MLDERLLDAIYASSLGEGALPLALQGLARACRSRSAGVFRLSQSGLEQEINYGLPEGFMGEFSAQLESDPRIGFSLARAPLTLMDDGSQELRRQMHDSGTEAMTRRWDLPWTLAMLCAFEGDAAWALFLSRSASQGPADSAERDSFQAYAHHFARALQLRIRAGQALRQWHAPAAGPAARMARLMIDSEARVQEHDENTAQIVHEIDGLGLCRGRLTLADARADSRLRQMATYLGRAPRLDRYSGILEVPQQHPAGMLFIQIDSTPFHSRFGGRLLTVWLQRRTWDTSLGGQQACAPPSPRQMEVLHRLDRGLSTAEIAAELGIGDSTVRTHIKHLLALTQTHNRRACLARARQFGWL